MRNGVTGVTRRRGRSTTAAAFTEAAHITALWARHGHFPDRRLHLMAMLHGHDRFTTHLSGDHPLLPIVTYPETVDLAIVLTDPEWRHPEPSAMQRIEQFTRDVNDRVGIRYRPTGSAYDPLFGWFYKRNAPLTVDHQSDDKLRQIV